jgi:AraC-like DNA-binding protein
LHVGPALVAHDGSQHTVSLELTPLGARALLRAPAAALAGTVVELDSLLGRDASELVDRLAGAADWRACFDVLDDILTRRARHNAILEGPVERAWHRIAESGGAIRIGDLARETGYSRRQLAKRFVGEYGITPKQASRVMRFERSWRVLRRLERRRRASPRTKRRSLAQLAVTFGYYDQSHLAREWNELAGCPPSTWLAVEELPFVQDANGEPT